MRYARELLKILPPAISGGRGGANNWQRLRSQRETENHVCFLRARIGRYFCEDWNGERVCHLDILCGFQREVGDSEAIRIIKVRGEGDGAGRDENVLCVHCILHFAITNCKGITICIGSALFSCFLFIKNFINFRFVNF